MINLSLFDISMEFIGLRDLMESIEVDENGVILDNSKEIEELYNNIKLSLEEKLDNSQRYCLTLDGEAEILDKEIKRLQAKKTSLKNKKERLRTMMLSALQVSGHDKLKTSLYNFLTRKSTSVEANEDELKREYLKISYSADKKKIGEVLKSGGIVDGAKLVEKTSLNVR